MRLLFDNKEAFMGGIDGPGPVHGRRIARRTVVIGWAADAHRKAVAALAGSLLILGIGALSLASPAAAQPSTWTIASSPNTSASQTNDLYGVSCASASSCVAVGSYKGAVYFQTLIETFDGTTWSIVPSPNTSTSQSNQLGGVSCASATWCVAVGSYNNGSHDQTLIETFDGSTWSIASSPNASTSQNNQLNAVSCASATSCVAVGSASNGTADQTLIETLSGTTWTIASSPDTSGSHANDLFGVSCATATSCVAVGSASIPVGGGTVLQTLIESLSGSTWSIAASPNTSTSQNNELDAVSCSSAASCVAVGDYEGPTTNQTLVETFDGGSWNITSSPNTSASENNFLYGVSCTSASSCVAVGIHETPYQQTLVETFDGSAWSVVSSPNTSTVLYNDLFAASCPSSGPCVAVGDAANGAVRQTLIETGAGPIPHALTNGGYTMVGSEGGIFAFGNAHYYGSLPGLGIHVSDIVGIIGTHDGGGYTMVGSDGGIFAFGDAQFHGSLPGLGIHVGNIKGVASPDSGGYTLVGWDGGVFAFGDAQYHGSLPGSGVHVNNIEGLVTPDAGGYTMVGSDGGAFAFGDAQYLGSLPGLGVAADDIVGLAAPDAGGYWIAGSDGGIFAFGDAQYHGSLPGLGIHVNNIVGLIGS
jgi:hypothetical protein